MNRERLIFFLLLTLTFLGATMIYFAQAWNESTTKFRAGMPVPRSLVPEELLTDEERIPKGPPQPVTIRPTDPLLYGAASSPIMIVLVADFQSDVCKNQSAAIKDAIRLTGATDKVGVVWRDFPMVNEHSKAMSAAVVGRCAAAQGQFTQMHDLLFSDAKEYTEDEYVRFARKINLNEQDFRICMRDPAIPFHISQDIEAERMLAIKEVPTMFVNGYPIAGFVDTETLSSILRNELQRVTNTK